MANSELYNKTYKIPSDVIKHIQTTLVSNSHGEGVKRAKFMLKNGYLTYQALKRLKNFFDYFNPQSDDKIQYELAGGDLMKSFINGTLNQERAGAERSKELKRDIHMNPNSELSPYQTPRLNETGIEYMMRTIDAEILQSIINEETKDLRKNAVAIIVNSDNKILLLKRSDEPKQWMPSKWALVGGGVENKEKPEEAIKREVKEETGLEIDKFTNAITIQRHRDSIEYLFACRYDDELINITLNDENTNYGWFGIEEMKFLDIVPNLVEYIKLVFKKYE